MVSAIKICQWESMLPRCLHTQTCFNKQVSVEAIRCPLCWTGISARDRTNTFHMEPQLLLSRRLDARFHLVHT